MLASGYIPITNQQLIISLSLVLITGLVSMFLQLGLLKPLIWGTVRAFIQLMLIGYLLTFIFRLNHPLIIIAIILLMSFIASREATRRITRTPFKPALLSFVTLTASTFLVGLIVVTTVIAPEPWYEARVMIPIFGMILGNSMNAVALTLDRMFGEVYAHIEEVEQMLCFGATSWEAIRTYARKAVEAGMTPTINSLMVVGLVSLPGMMTGQILAGMDPQEAVRYQFVVLIMIAAAVAISCLAIVVLTYRKIFNDEMALEESIINK